MLNPADIHERIAAYIEQALANPNIPGAWRQSRFTYEQFGSMEAAEIEHHSFAIGMPASDPDPGDRQTHREIRTTTEVSIRWGHRLRSDAAVVDTLLARKAEAELTAAVRDTPSDPSLGIDVTGWRRTTTRDGLLFLGELGLRVVHLYTA